LANDALDCLIGQFNDFKSIPRFQIAGFSDASPCGLTVRPVCTRLR
jgi:hypothetical protein